MNEPIEREGLVYSQDELRRYFELPKAPPSMIDAVTGATPKSKKAAQASAQLEGSYVLGINMMSRCV